MQKFVPRSDVGIFRNERTQSTPLELCSILVHLGSFRNCMKLGAKRGELVQLMQKFVPWIHVRIFHNERTQSTPLDPCSILVHLGSFRNCIKLGAKHGERVQLMQKLVPRSDVGTFCNERTQSTPLYLCSILVHLGLFRNCMKLGAKRGELVQLMQKFMPWSHVEIFRNRHTQSSPLDLCNILVHLGSFRNCMKLGAKRGDLCN